MQSAAPIEANKQAVVSIFSEPLAAKYSPNLPFEPDFGVITRVFLDGLSETGQPGLSNGRLLLPLDHVWSSNGKTRAPMALCEFVAYKSALAYEKETDVKSNLGNVKHFKFFDSSKVLSDTQGFAFAYDGMAFVIMRGTENRKDWKINLQDQFTDELQGRKSRRLVKRLKNRHGSAIAPLVGELAAKPGRHVGFAIGWAAVHKEISTHLKEKCPGLPVVLSGHSLGGALALIGARELKRDGHNIAAVITFGAPQAGNDAFTKEYIAEGLNERTVLFEAQGDSVPRVMRRWYYRLNRSLRDSIDRFAESNGMALPDRKYAVAGHPWVFVAQPALSAREVTGAIGAIKRRVKEEAERKAKEDAERKTKEDAERKTKEETERKAKEQADRRAREAPQPPHAAASPEPGAGSASAVSTPAQAAAARQTGSTDGTGWLIAGGILGLILLLLLWIFVRGKLSAHAVMDRYALFLSTLSYQRIRALRALDPCMAADKLKFANDDLTKYMRFIRADSGNESYIKKAKAVDLPVRLATDFEIETYLSEPRNII